MTWSYQRQAVVSASCRETEKIDTTFQAGKANVHHRLTLAHVSVITREFLTTDRRFAFVALRISQLLPCLGLTFAGWGFSASPRQ